MLLFDLRSAAMLLAISLTLWAWWRIHAPRSRAFVLLGIITSLALPLEVYGYVTTLKELNNSLAYNLFTCVEFALMLAMITSTQPQLRKTAIVFGAFGAMGVAWDCTVADPRTAMLIEAIMIMSLLLAILLSIGLWNLASASTVALSRVPEFWLFMGLLVYFGGLPPVVAMARYVYAQDKALVTVLWTIVPVLCIIRYLFAAHACRLVARQRAVQHNG